MNEAMNKAMECTPSSQVYFALTFCTTTSMKSGQEGPGLGGGLALIPASL